METHTLSSSSLVYTALTWSVQSSWSSAHAIPFYAAILSAIGLLLLMLCRTDLTNINDLFPSTIDTQKHSRKRVIFVAGVLRFIGCLELLRVSVSRFLAIRDSESRQALVLDCIVFVRHVYLEITPLLIFPYLVLFYPPCTLFCCT